jgi:hypothetical protein
MGQLQIKYRLVELGDEGTGVKDRSPTGHLIQVRAQKTRESLLAALETLGRLIIEVAKSYQNTPMIAR